MLKLRHSSKKYYEGPALDLTGTSKRCVSDSSRINIQIYNIFVLFDQCELIIIVTLS